MDIAPQLVTGAFTLGGVAVGGVVTFLVQIIVRWMDTKGERRALANSLAAEIGAYLDLMAARKHIEHARALVAANQGGVLAVPKNWISKHEQSTEPFPVLKANLATICRLGPVCEEVAAFYAKVMGVRATIISAGEGAFDNQPPALIAELIAGEIALWTEAVGIGERAVRELRRLGGGRRR